MREKKRIKQPWPTQIASRAKFLKLELAKGRIKKLQGSVKNTRGLRLLASIGLSHSLQKISPFIIQN
jgi:hypothetical protein